MIPLLFLALSQLLAVNAQCQASSSLSWKNQPKAAAEVGARVIYNGLTKPRGLRVAHDSVFVIDRGVGLIGLVENSTSCEGFTKSVLVSRPDLSHGLAIEGTNLYASSSNIVYRWTYDVAARNVSRQTPIVTNMDPTGKNNTRTLEIQPASGSSPAYLIVSAGSNDDIEVGAGDVTHGVAQIRRFALTDSIPAGGYQWLSGEVVASGLKNAVGISISADGKQLWAVENSIDVSMHLGVDIHQDNPAEELNLIDMSDLGHSYGYPSCATTFDIKSVDANTNLHTGDQFSIDSAISDARCADPSFNVPPRLSLTAHTAPLDIVFYSAPSDGTYAVTSSWNSQAFISLHGSIGRTPAVGYGIIRIPWSGNQPSAGVTSTTGFDYIFQASDLSKCPGGCVRPVGLDFDSRGRLFGSSDTTGEIFVIESPNAPGVKPPVTITNGASRSGLSYSVVALLAIVTAFSML